MSKVNTQSAQAASLQVAAHRGSTAIDVPELVPDLFSEGQTVHRAQYAQWILLRL